MIGSAADYVYLNVGIKDTRRGAGVDYVYLNVGIKDTRRGAGVDYVYLGDVVPALSRFYASDAVAWHELETARGAELRAQATQENAQAYTEARLVARFSAGPTAARPTAPTGPHVFLDETLGRPVFWILGQWVDGTGAPA